MNNPTLADQAFENLKKMTECLEQAAKISAEHQQAIKDLQTIAKFQAERLDIQGKSIRALQAILRNLDERLQARGERSFSA